jgi:hypothetical protein
MRVSLCSGKSTYNATVWKIWLLRCAYRPLADFLFI